MAHRIGGLGGAVRPREPVRAIRWAFLLFGIANLAPALAIAALGAGAPWLRLLAPAALVILAVAWIAAYNRGALEVADDALGLVAVLAVAAAMSGSPGQGDLVGVVFGAVFYCSLFGSLPRVLARVAGFAAINVLVPLPDAAALPSRALVAFGILVVAILVHLLLTFVERYESGARRQQVLAATGLALVAAADVPQIADSAVEGAMTLCSGVAGLRITFAIEKVADGDATGAPEPGVGPRLVVIAAAGQSGGGCVGRSIDPSRLPEAEAWAAEQHEFHFAAADAERIAAAGLPLAGQTLLTTRIDVDGRRRGLLLVEAAGGIGEEIASSLRALATEVSLAISRADLAVSAAARHGAERFRALVQNSSDVITIIDPEGRIRFQSPSALRIFGYDPETLSSTPVTGLIHPDDVERVTAAFRDVLADPAGAAVVECRIRNAAGGWRDTETRVCNLLAEPAVNGLVLNTRDVTERRLLEEELRKQAFHDGLTGLANRTLFGERVQQAILHARRDGSSLAVLFIDIQGFRRLNDSLGYAAGDVALVAVADRLLASVRAPDTVARLGGDEFGVLLDRLTSPADATIAVERIMAALRQPVALAGASVELQPCIGIAVSIGGDDSAEDLIRNGAVAMHRARTFEGGYTIFDPEMHAAAIRRLEVESQLRTAIEEHQLVVHYQPTVDLQTGRLTGVEALVRWQHPKRGLVPPTEFIPLAEESGLIVPLGVSVIREACRQVRRWQQEIPADEPLSLGVNLSARQLRHPNIVRDIADALDDSGLLPSRLILEITESVLMVDTAVTLSKLFQLKSLGVRLAIDDFGTGYSSFAYLRRFPVDILKIDKSFIDGVATEPTASVLVDAMIRIGKTLRLETVAEGVERAEQAEQLRSLSCDTAQGYLFSRPLARDAIATFLHERAAARGEDQAA